MTEKELKESLNREEYKNLYYFHGAEKFLINFYTNHIISSLLTKEEETFNLTTLSGYVTAKEFDEAVNAFPVFADKRVVLIENWNIEKIDELELKRYLVPIGNIPDDTVVIAAQKSTSADLKKPRVKKLLDCANGKVIINFKTATLETATNFAGEIACCYDIKLSYENARHLAESVLFDMFSVQSEAEKLSSYALNKDSKEIDKNDIDNLCVKKTDVKIYELTDAVFAKNTKKAFRLYRELRDIRTEPTVIVYSLGTEYANLYRAKMAILENIKETQFAKECAYPSNMFWKSGKDLQKARMLPLEKLNKAVSLIIKTEIKLKSVVTIPYIEVEKLIAKLCTI